MPPPAASPGSPRRLALAALEAVGGAALWLVVLLLALGSLERNLVGTSYVGNIDDVIGFLMAGLFVLGLPIALARGGHVRIDLFYRLYPAGLRRRVDKGFRVFGVAAALGIAGAGLALVLDSYGRERMYYGIIEFPLWIPQFIVVVGALAFAVEFLFADDNPNSATDL